MPPETSKHAAPSLQIGNKKREAHKDTPVADEHVLDTVFGADHSEPAGCKDAEMHSRSEKKTTTTFTIQAQPHLETPTAKTVWHSSACRNFFPEITVDSPSTNDSLALAQARKDSMNRAARAQGPHQQFAGGRDPIAAEC